MSRPWASTAIFSVLLSTLPVAGHSETIFRCGSTYSQTPCAGAAQINIDDERDPSRKQEVDNATRRDAKLAKSLEQERLQAEKMANSPTQDNPKAYAPVSQTTQITTTEAPPTTLTPKRPRKQTYKPKGFIALVPGSDVKAASAKKATKKRAAASK